MTPLATPLADVWKILGVTDARHQRNCLAHAKIVLEELPRSREDGRRRLVTPEEVERLKAAHAKLYSARTRDDDLVRRLEAVEQALAELREHSPYLFRPRVSGAIPAAEVPPIRLPVQRPSRAPVARTEGHPVDVLPDTERGWAEWIARHSTIGFSGAREWFRGRDGRMAEDWRSWHTIADAAAVMRRRGYPLQPCGNAACICHQEDGAAEE